MLDFFEIFDIVDNKIETSAIKKAIEKEKMMMAMKATRNQWNEDHQEKD